MLCSNCAKLATAYTNKACVRCQGAVYTNISVLCDKCSTSNNQCQACLKNIVTTEQRALKGCNGGRK